MIETWKTDFKLFAKSLNLSRDDYKTMMEYINEVPAVQPDHNADVSKKVDMMHEYIYKIVQDCDGVNCYIKQGKIIRCKDCKHKHVKNMVWTCPFGFSGGENFFCGYGTEPYKGE